ncbi:hypothetical protein [Halalkalibacter flavus]
MLEKWLILKEDLYVAASLLLGTLSAIALVSVLLYQIATLLFKR